MRIKNIAQLYLIISFVIALTAPFFIPAYAVEQPGLTSIVNINFPCPSGEIVLGKCSSESLTSSDFNLYIKRFYQFAAGIAGILAVGMIVIGSYFYSVSGVVDKKSEGKAMIVSALWGIALLFGSYLILNTINPEIVKLSRPSGIKKLEQGPCEKGQIFEGDKCVDVVEETYQENCKKFSEIPVLAGQSGDGNELGLKCGKRRVSIEDDIRVDDDLEVDGKNYYETDETIDGDGRPDEAHLWLYPYYRSELGTSSARCLIYAYKETGEDDVEMTGLNPNLKLCPSQVQDDKQENSSSSDDGSSSQSGCSDSDTIPGNTLSDNDARTALNNYGITITSSGGCTDRCNKNCTSLKGLPTSVYTNLIKIKSAAGCGEGTSVVITGGTEVGHQTHGIGKSAVDLKFNVDLATCLRSKPSALGITKICTTNARQGYRYNCTYPEQQEHLHVQF